MCFVLLFLSSWWFQTFFMFTPIWGRFPFWLIVFRWVETTNQLCLFNHCFWLIVAQFAQFVFYVPKSWSFSEFRHSENGVGCLFDWSGESGIKIGNIIFGLWRWSNLDGNLWQEQWKPPRHAFCDIWKKKDACQLNSRHVFFFTYTYIRHVLKTLVKKVSVFISDVDIERSWLGFL